MQAGTSWIYMVWQTVMPLVAWCDGLMSRGHRSWRSFRECEGYSRLPSHRGCALPWPLHGGGLHDGWPWTCRSWPLDGRHGACSYRSGKSFCPPCQNANLLGCWLLWRLLSSCQRKSGTVLVIHFESEIDRLVYHLYEVKQYLSPFLFDSCLDVTFSPWFPGYGNKVASRWVHEKIIDEIWPYSVLCNRLPPVIDANPKFHKLYQMYIFVAWWLNIHLRKFSKQLKCASIFNSIFDS